MTRIRTVVVGAGHLGRIHARLLGSLEQVDLIGIVDPSPEARQLAAQETGRPTFTSVAELPAQPTAAIVATPTRHHTAVAVELLERGVHCLVEKPLAATLAECDQILAAAKRGRAVLQVGHIEQFNPAWQDVQPHLGQPRYIEASRFSGYTFRSTDIGVVLDLMVHDLDLILSVVRSPLRKVDAIGISVLGGHEDIAQARLVFANGCVANVNASRCSFQPKREMQLWSERGFAQVDFGARKATLIEPVDELATRAFNGAKLTPQQRAAVRDNLFTSWLPKREFESPASNALLDELRDFVESIEQQRAPRVTGEQGRSALAVCEQILARIETHAWDGEHGQMIGPLAMPMPTILQPHSWPVEPNESRKKAS